MTFILFFLIGTFAGMMSGLLGIGGGIVVVPLLALIFQDLHMPPANIMHLAAGTSLAVLTVTTLRSLFSHRIHWKGSWEIFSQLMPGIIVGTVCGAVLAYFMHSRMLSRIFGVLVLFMAFEMILQKTINPTRKLPGVWGMALAGSGIGLMSGLLGVGGGITAIPFLNYCNVPLRKAMVVTLIIGLTVSIIGTMSFIVLGWHIKVLPAGTTGYIYWPAWLPVSLGSVIFAPIGAALSFRLPVIFLKRLFAVFLMVVAFHML